MPPSDYTSTGGGLKLKGAKDANVDKKRNKKKKRTTDKDRTASISKDPSPHPPDPEAADKSTSSSSKAAQALQDEEESIQTQDVSAREVRDFGKTEAQRRHEERRRKTLDERLKREGVKTHKERVEELNKYLSGLSEHHDMPRIGPG